MARFHVHPLLLKDQGRHYATQAKALEDTLKEGVPLLAQLGKDGLGWDVGGRKFAVPFWGQQGTALEVLANMANVFAEINQGLNILAKRLPQADADTAARFKRLLRELEDGPSIRPYTEKGAP